ncbi:MAG: 50S ribosomal protein L24 [Clostridia bacterium]|nr:50S ribosomal protein L24 [Clostridia bacterium]
MEVSKLSNKLHVKKDDTVLILSGNSRGNQGKVLEVSPKEGKVIVERQNMVKKHVKPRKMGDPGGIIEAEGALYACKVQVVCPNCNKPTRVGYKKIADDNGKLRSVRVCKKCGETL